MTHQPQQLDLFPDAPEARPDTVARSFPAALDQPSVGEGAVRCEGCGRVLVLDTVSDALRGCVCGARRESAAARAEQRWALR